MNKKELYLARLDSEGLSRPTTDPDVLARAVAFAAKHGLTANADKTPGTKAKPNAPAKQ